MADPNNQGQFGNREDTEIQAEKGGLSISNKNQASSDRSKAGKKGAQAQPRSAKAKGGRHSHDSR